jgi:hypothetical protein
MIVNAPLLLLSKAAMSPIILITIGLAWFSWERTIEAIPATLFSLGVALLALMLLVVAAYSSDNSQVFVELMSLAIACTLLVCFATLIALVRNANISTAKATACGLVGLVPLHFTSGFVLIHAVCSFRPLLVL